MTARPAPSKHDWQFDHLSLQAPPGDTGIDRLAALLGLQPGRRPAFPFGGRWFYQGAAPVLHVIDAPGEEDAAFDHIAFRSHHPLESVLPAIVSCGLPYCVKRIPETATAQIFIQVAERFVLELDVPEGTASAVVTDYSSSHVE